MVSALKAVRAESEPLLQAALPLLFLLALFVYPVARFLLLSIEGGSLAQYEKALFDGLYVHVLVDTFRIALIVTIITLILGYPIAYFLSSAPPRWATIGLVFLILPFWTSVLIRTYAWSVILGRNGVINRFLLSSEIVDEPLRLLNNELGVLIGMVHVLLPYMVFPLYAVMRRQDPTLLLASQGLGASAPQTFWRIFLPLSVPGILAGTTLVFVLSIGFFITPAVLGGGKVMMIAVLIEHQVRGLSNWPFAAALSTVLLAAALVMYALLSRCVACKALMPTERRHRRPKKPWTVALYVYCALVFAFLMLPMLIVAVLSFSSSPYVVFPPPGFSLRWYATYFADPIWIDATIRSVKVGVATTIGATVLGTLLAFSLVRGRYPGKALVDQLSIAPLIVPSIVYSVAIYIMFAQMRMIGEWPTIALAHTVHTLPFVILIVGAALRTFDVAQEQAAVGLGATRFQAITKVTLPQIRPALISAAFLVFISSFDELVIAMFLGGSRMTLPKKMFDNIMNDIDPTIAAVSVMQIALVIVVLAITSRFGAGAKPVA